MIKLNQNRVSQILSQFSKQKILVFGDVGVDKYTIGKVHRISPEAPIPVVEVTETKLKLGLAANVADNIAALGGKSLLVGLIGDDHPGQEFISLLRQSKISDRNLMMDSGRNTILKERVVAENQQVVRIDHETAQKPSVKTMRAVWEKLDQALWDANGVVVEDYAKGLVDNAICQKLINAAKEMGLPVFVDPNSQTNPQLYNGCTLVTPNSAEAEALSGIKIKNISSLCQVGQKILDLVDSKSVIITRGKDGMAVFNRGQTEPVLIPTFAREVFDVSGAGDTVIATLALAVASGANIIEAALIANVAAGIEVGKRGTAVVTASELLDYIEFISRRKEVVHSKALQDGTSRA